MSQFIIVSKKSHIGQFPESYFASVEFLQLVHLYFNDLFFCKLDRLPFATFMTYNFTFKGVCNFLFCFCFPLDFKSHLHYEGHLEVGFEPTAAGFSHMIITFK
jgi:hypothetical protein